MSTIFNDVKCFLGYHGQLKYLPYVGKPDYDAIVCVLCRRFVYDDIRNYIDLGGEVVLNGL